MRRFLTPALGLLCALVAVACSDNEDDTGQASGGNAGSAGKGQGAGGNGGTINIPDGGGAGGAAGASGDCGSNLVGTIRDFKVAHPDFEYVIADDRGMVEQTLGSDKKPVYASDATTPTTNGRESFDQWYRDVDGINQKRQFKLEFVENGNGLNTFEDNDFFPIDDLLFGNEGNAHNFHFTFELHTTFEYQGGEEFTFTGDDDVFTFINGSLVVDLGGVHGAQTDTVTLDDQAASLGLEIGKIYPLDFFFAERHTTQSNFRIDTNLYFKDCGDDPE